MSGMNPVQFGAIYRVDGLGAEQNKLFCEKAAEAHATSGGNAATAAAFEVVDEAVEPGQTNSSAGSYLVTFQDAVDYRAMLGSLQVMFPEKSADAPADPMTEMLRKGAIAGLNRSFVEGRVGSIQKIDIGPATGKVTGKGGLILLANDLKDAATA